MLKSDLNATLWVIGGALLISLFARGRELASFSFLLMVWMIVEGVQGKRSWASMGFRLDNLWIELKRNAALIGVVGVGVQAAFWVTARFLYPPLWDQIQGRLTSMRVWFPSLTLLLTFVILETLLEEASCRGFVQGRLVPHIGTLLAIVLAAILHTGFHWQVHVSLAATIVDLAFVFVDNLIYGWIFARSENIFVAWLPHLLADAVSLAMLL
jgi:membrane protease YdiL (CAAX protease family)